MKLRSAPFFIGLKSCQRANLPAESMRLHQLVIRNAARTPLRTLMTVVAVALMLTAFIFPRTLVEATTPTSIVRCRSKKFHGHRPRRSLRGLHRERVRDAAELIRGDPLHPS